MEGQGAGYLERYAGSGTLLPPNEVKVNVNMRVITINSLKEMRDEK